MLLTRTMTTLALTALLAGCALFRNDPPAAGPESAATEATEATATATPTVEAVTVIPAADTAPVEAAAPASEDVIFADSEAPVAPEREVIFADAEAPAPAAPAADPAPMASPGRPATGSSEAAPAKETAATPAPAKQAEPAPATPAPTVSTSTREAAQPAAPAVATPAPTRVAKAPTATPRATSEPSLDLDELENKLRKTKAIGLFTKLEIKGQVEDLVSQVGAFHEGKSRLELPELEQRFNLLVMKLLTLLQDDDPVLRREIASARPALWNTLSDPTRFATVRGP